jgi:chloramphenicol 3-O-phosphotransferase
VYVAKNMEALQTMQEPQNGADLVQYVAAVNWMRSAFPNYSKRVAPFQAALAKVFEDKSRRTKKAAAAVSLLRTPLGTRGASGFQRFTSSYHGFNDVGIPRPRQEDLCLDGCIGSLL